jgi:hypothetical protein
MYTFHLYDALPTELYGAIFNTLNYTAAVINQKLANLPTDNFYKTIAVYKNDNLAALATLYNNSIIYQNTNALFIGLYECEEDDKTANFLFNTINSINLLNCKTLIGPCNGSTWEAYRFNSSGTTLLPPFTGEFIHQSYYAKQWQANGFGILAKYSTDIATQISLYKPDKIAELEKKIIANGTIIRNINLSELDKELEAIHTFSLVAFKNNFLYSPLSNTSFINKYKKLKSIMNPAYILLAEKNESIIGFLFAYKDVMLPNTIIIKTLAALGGKANLGLGYILCNKLLNNAINNGITQLISAYMHNDNTSINSSKHYTHGVYRNYELFKKDL